jgi:hypothetical protein
VPRAMARAASFTSDEYLSFVRTKPCFLCGAFPVDTHHLWSRGWREWKRRDHLVLPVCRRCHGEIHSLGMSAVLARRNLRGRDLVTAVADLLVEYFGGRNGKVDLPF